MTDSWGQEILDVPLRLGLRVRPYGKISAVGWTGGERYYWLTKGRDVAMIPATVLEPMASRDTGEDKP